MLVALAAPEGWVPETTYDNQATMIRIGTR